MTELSLNRLTERAVTAGVGCLLVGVVSVVDETVRQRVLGVFTGGASSEFSLANAHVQRAVTMATDLIGFQSDHVSPGMFLIAALVFLVFMITSLRK